ncbi:MAG: peptidoglycan DD-metalloendopeptidase family protein [Gallionella sp.]
MKPIHICALLLISIALAGCASGGHHAPVVDRSLEGKGGATSSEAARKKSHREKDWRPESIVVQKGDTLYSIAFNYGFDYHELAELNGIKDPSVISVGQEIHLFPGRSINAVRPGAAAVSKPAEPIVKDQPKLVKYPYSDAALAQIEKVQEPAKPATASIAAADNAKPDDESNDAPDESEEAAIEWGMPTKGKLIGQFSESANRKGIDIAGKLGQPILASAAGKVVYSGSGLRGYGKLIIIKHNKTYLSAYAHNDKIVVKEGQSVARGQKIAEMGNTDAKRVELHFEVRRLGQPVDPAKYLPIGKS